jgi:predicted nucleic acid-binding protein
VTVYVETNLILEITLQQEESAAAEELLCLAEASRIEMAFPAFAICEPFETLRRRTLHREQLSSAIAKELRELARSQPHSGYAGEFHLIAERFAVISKSQVDALEQTLRRVLRVASILPIDYAVFDRAIAYETRYSLTAQDAIVLASVLLDLERVPAGNAKCFLSRNPKDFDDPALDAELAVFNCRYIARFAHGLSFVQSRM